MTDGSTATSEFVIPTDAVDDGASPLTELCGSRSYAITKSDGSTVTTWAAITTSSTAGSMTLTIDTNQYGAITSTITETLTVTTTLVSHSGATASTSTIVVTLNTLACDCSSLAWNAPTITTNTVNVDASSTPSVPAPVSDTSARSSVPAFDACYDSGANCATTGTYAANSLVQSNGSALPAWIIWDDTNQVLTVTPNDPSYAGTYTILGTYTPTNGSASQFTVVTLTVNCVVTSVTRPTNPSTGLDYNLWDSTLSFDFSQDWV